MLIVVFKILPNMYEVVSIHEQFYSHEEIHYFHPFLVLGTTLLCLQTLSPPGGSLLSNRQAKVIRHILFHDGNMIPGSLRDVRMQYTML